MDGLWRAASGGAVVEFHACGDALCGRLVRSTDLDANPGIRDNANRNPALRSRAIKGLDILHGFRGGPVVWTDGRIYDPGSGRTYTGALRLVSPDQVKLSGCLIYPLCGSQVWRKVP